MPQTIDIEKFKTQMTFDVSAPQGSPTGIPVKQIPYMEYPRVVYKHPLEPFRTILHRNTKQEVVREEIVATEHIALKVEDEAGLKKAMKEGYELKPYVPQAPPDPDAHLYSKQGEEKHGRPSS